MRSAPMRRLRSRVRATCSAASVSCFTGVSAARATSRPSHTASATPPRPISASAKARSRSVLSTSSSGRTACTASPVGSLAVYTRACTPPIVASLKKASRSPGRHLQHALVDRQLDRVPRGRDDRAVGPHDLGIGVAAAERARGQHEHVLAGRRAGQQQLRGYRDPARRCPAGSRPPGRAAAAHHEEDDARGEHHGDRHGGGGQQRDALAERHPRDALAQRGCRPGDGSSQRRAQIGAHSSRST